PPRGRGMGEGRFMESEHLQNSDESWGHEPGLRKSLDCRQTTFRFMESLLSLLRTHWDHEPDWHASPCPLPARRGEGGRRPGDGAVHGEACHKREFKACGPRISTSHRVPTV